MRKRKIIGYSGGKPITERDIKRIAREAEKGYDLDRLKPRVGRPPMGSAAAPVVPVRLDPELRAAVDARAEKDDASTSEVIRRALRRYLGVA